MLALVAERLRLPAAILQMAGGLTLGLIPGTPSVELPPDLIFVLFVPAIVYNAGFASSLRDLRANAGAIASLAVGLVLATAGAIAVIAHALVPELPWAAAFALGAVVAPTDIAATRAILDRLGMPRGLLTLLEGEGLLNDSTAVVTFRAAVAAAVLGTFSAERALLSFILVGAGGLVCGVAFGYVVTALRRRIDDPLIEITISLLTPYVVYLTGEALGVSGILATVAAAIFIGRRGPTIMSARSRVAGVAVWQLVSFLLESAIFMLIGLVLPGIVASLMSESLGSVLGVAIAVGLGVIAVRLLWVFPFTYVRHALRRRRSDPAPDPRHVFVVGWAGMRGMITVTTALSLPLVAEDGSPFPGRPLVIFIAAAVVVITLVGQGLTLSPILRVLGVAADEGESFEETHAREVTGEAALRRLDELEREWPTHLELIAQLRRQFTHRAEHRERRGADARAADQEEMEHRTIRHAVLDAERTAAVDLRNEGAISDGVLRLVERDIDLEELRMDV